MYNRGEQRPTHSFPRFPMDLTLIGQLISLAAVVAAGPLVIVFLAARRGAL